MQRVHCSGLASIELAIVLIRSGCFSQVGGTTISYSIFHSENAEGRKLAAVNGSRGG